MRTVLQVVFVLAMLMNAAEATADPGSGIWIQARDPDGNVAKVQFIRYIPPVDQLAQVRFNAHYESVVMILDNSIASGAELMRFGTAKHHNRNTGARLRAGRAYLITSWHKESNSDPRRPWLYSQIRARHSPNGELRVEVDDSVIGKGDASFDDVIVSFRASARRHRGNGWQHWSRR